MLNIDKNFISNNKYNITWSQELFDGVNINGRYIETLNGNRIFLEKIILNMKTKIELNKEDIENILKEKYGENIEFEYIIEKELQRTKKYTIQEKCTLKKININKIGDK